MVKVGSYCWSSASAPTASHDHRWDRSEPGVWTWPAGQLSGWAGLYEVTPDAHPILDFTPVESFMVVAGFSGHGFMHGPIAGKLMCEFITGGEAHTVDVTMLDLARFIKDHLIPEYNVV